MSASIEFGRDCHLFFVRPKFLLYTIPLCGATANRAMNSTSLEREKNDLI